jgi:hypothetical protein
MTTIVQERPFEQQACLAFVGLSVTIGVIGFWSKGMLPGALLTVAMGVIVYLLSRAVERVQEAWTTKNFFTGCVATFLAAGFVAIEASLNHIGLEHLNTTHDLAPAEYLWPACWFVSLVNVFASYSFGRTLEDRRAKYQRPAPTPRRSEERADNIVMFGSDPQERKTLEAVVSKMKAGGML